MTNLNIEELPLAKLVLMKPESANLFEKHNLDFCCKGKQSLKEALKGRTEELNTIKNELAGLFNDGDVKPIHDFEKYSLSVLVNYIINVHHKYVKENGPTILAHLEKIAAKHGERHPELREIQILFKDVKRELDQHMMKEELVLFPRIKTLELPSEYGTPAIQVSTVINVMEAEHLAAGNEMYAIRMMTANYTPPQDACTTYKLCFEELRLFEIDLHQHVHLENNILFPRALKLESKN